MGNLGAHVKSVHHLPFSKKAYQESLKVHISQSAQEGGGVIQTEAPSDAAANQSQSTAQPEGPAAAPSGGVTLPPLPVASGGPIVLYDKKTILEHYQKKAYEEHSNMAAYFCTMFFCV